MSEKKRGRPATMAKCNDKFSPHITVQQTGVRPPLEKCVTCCTSIHCPFCSPDKFKPTIRSRVCKHLEGHLLRAVQLKDYTIYKCNLECLKKRAHFHCPSCTLLFDRRDRLLKHMPKCFTEVLEVVDQSATTNNSDHEEDVNMVFSGHMEEVQCKQEATEIQVDIMDDVHSTRDNTENLVHIKEDVHSSRDNTENQVHIMEDCHSTRDATENQVHIVEDVHSSQEAKVATAQVRRSKVVVSCPRCAIGILKKNLNMHLLRKHSEHHRMEVTSKSNVHSEGLDSAKRRCSKTRQSCQHKSIAKWHSCQECPGVFQKVRSSQYISENQPIQTGTLENTSGSEDDFTRYPPEGEDLKKMVEYISQHKRLPTTLPDHLRKHMSDYPRCFIPEEEFCTVCPGAVSLSRPIVITEKAKILTLDGIVQDVSTFCRKCEDCGMIYRYQEFTDGVHNFNDYLLLGLHFCLFLRYQLQTNQAVGSAVQALEQLTKTKFPPADSVMHGYLHFEAMSSHSYDFSCVCCGDQPPIVIMDLHKKGAFHQTVSDLQSPPDDYKGEVNMEDFWDSVSNEHIALGFLTSIQMNPYAVSPSFDCWAPWIGERTRRSAVALNTEFQKLQTPGENAEWTVTEDHLLNELLNQEVEVVRKLCEECDLDPGGSRMDLIFRLKDEMKTPESFEKVFQKIWGASGGWAAILCPCGIVYSLKGLLRAGRPRDFADLLLSWAHVPNKVVYDFSSVLARQMKLRAPESVPFAPHEGRLVAPTTQNIGGANEGSLKVNLTWLTEKRNPADERSHPLTGSSESYALRNTSEDSGNVLSRVGLAPELSGRINTQVVKLFFSQMRECNYFLTQSSPSTNIFLLRNILHHRNVRVNESSTGQI